MRYAALPLCALLLFAGCLGSPGATTPDDPVTTYTTTQGTTTSTEATTTTTTSTTSSPPDTTTERRFDGEANAHVYARNAENESWTLTLRIERNGTVVSNETRTLEPGGYWDVTNIHRPGNYTFAASLADGRNSTETVRLPRAVGDRRTFVSVRKYSGEFRVLIYWEQ